MVSGKCAKPEDTDIKLVVKYTHEKLNPKHILDRSFDQLAFNQLIAGELELASRPGVSSLEKEDRINITKTICYHKQYLADDDLRTGYDNVLKKVEQGATSWGENLGGQLSDFYDYRANVILKTKLQHKEMPPRGDKHRAESGESTSSNSSSTDNYTFEDLERNKPVFCMEYNKLKCQHSNTHEGQFGGRKCLKWHICRRCRCFGEIRHHPEEDQNCPRRISQGNQA